MSDGTMQVRDDDLRNMRWRKQQAQQKRDKALRDLEEARSRLNVSTDELNRRTNYDAAQFQKALEEEERKMLDGIEKVDNELRAAMGRQNVLFRQQLDEVRQDIANSNASLDAVTKRIAELSDQMNKDIHLIAEKLSQQKDRAQLYINRVSALLEKINKLNPDKLTPGQAELLQDGLVLAKADMESGDYQAAMGLAQNNIPVAVSLLAELERKNDEYMRLECGVNAAILDVRNRIEELLDGEKNEKTIRLGEGVDEREYTYDGDVDYWSSGVFSLLCEKFEEEQRIVTEKFLAQMDLENLRIAEKAIPNYLIRLSRCEGFAYEEFAVSCNVQCMAVRIYSALTEDDSWNLQTSGFSEDDTRQAYFMNFSDNANNEVMIVVLPQKAPSGQKAAATQYIVAASDGPAGQSEGMREMLRNAVLARLASKGVEGGAGMNSCLSKSSRAEDAQKDICEGGRMIKAERIKGMRKKINI